MVTITSNQLQTLTDVALSGYVQRLVEHIGASHEQGESSDAADNGKLQLAQRVRALIDRAELYGFVCEGDVTPFVLLATIPRQEFGRGGVYEAVMELITATHLPAEQRMDGVYSLVPVELRDRLFPNFCFAPS